METQQADCLGKRNVPRLGLKVRYPALRGAAIDFEPNPPWLGAQTAWSAVTGLIAQRAVNPFSARSSPEFILETAMRRVHETSMKEHLTNFAMVRQGSKQKMQTHTRRRKKRQQNQTHFQDKQETTKTTENQKKGGSLKAHALRVHPLLKTSPPER